MKRLMIMLAAGTALTGCRVIEFEPPQAVPAPAEAVAPQPAAAPKPTYGTFGFDAAGMDPTVLPGDNFYQYANGTWAKNTQIPADKSNYGMFTVLDDLSKERTRTIIEEAAKDPNSKIGNAYNSYLDTAAIEAKGLAAFKPWLDQVRGLNEKAGSCRRSMPGPTASASARPSRFYIDQDDKNPDRYVTGLAQSGIGMPDRDYYLSPIPRSPRSAANIFSI